jgi:5' nucleotidase, deoxy (Pyrimidine), cytosolic type C protein (NT5C)
VDLGALFAAEAGRPLVACDIDNVLAFHAEAVCTAVNARFGASYLASQMTAYPFSNLLETEQAKWLAAHITRGPWIANLAPDRAASAALGRIHDAGHRVLIASDRPPQSAEATASWLDANRVPRDGQILEGPGSKGRALAANGPASPAVLIDDDPSKWLTIARPGVEVWSPMRPWTPQSWRQYPNVRVFSDWSEVLGRLGIS